ncbi:hypothetical protein WICMUC_001855 [Wickerhamomyces mucosus]|uniref:Dystroglycan-type cadherin-like domain-containing protein n=1 Tax=Wickerhamomyces mucosus TaxID=1378264 RepID=A0A9P8PT51_9ASCO|nr:hypothetical protein WICMUC_001855 [Wickerhamomyces mucosus]
MIVIFFLLLQLLNSINSQPYIGFPFDEQLPNIARVYEDYYFQISNETYLSDNGDVSYSITNAPDWLSFDSSTRALVGSPSSSDVSDSVTFTLVGNDNSGTSLEINQTIIVSDSTGPVPSSSYTVLSQLVNFGQTNGVDALVLAPGDIFNVTFDSKTFASDDDVIAYYGTSSDRSPLPNWLFFDSTDLRFSGVAPAVNSEIAPGVQYSFIFIATDFEGYTGSDVDFNIIVGAHQLTTSLKDTVHINGSAGVDISYDIPLSSVYYDGEAIALENINSISIEGNPDWLILNNYTLEGTVPNDFSTTDNSVFNVTIFDKYSDSVTLFFEIESIDSLFAVSSFISSNATRGKYFQYYFLSTDFTDYSNTNITVDFDDADWLEFHQSNLTINGDTPDDFEQTTISVTASDGSRSNELSFAVYGVDPISQSSSSIGSSTSSFSLSSTTKSDLASTPTTSTVVTSTSSTSYISATSSSTLSSIDSKSSHSNKGLAVGLGVGLGLLLLILLSLLLFLLFFRKKTNKSNNLDEENSPKISKPILGNPANGPNARGGQSPDSSLYTAGSDEKFLHIDDPHRLGALNVLKLDEKTYFEESATSSTTNVELDSDTNSSFYQDAIQAQSTDYLIPHPSQQEGGFPKKSWRQTIDSKINRESLNSLATVSTNELLTIRLADDDEIVKDPRKSTLNFRDSVFLGSGASSILTRDDSGNMQKLDSDGNIVEILKGDTPRKRLSRATNLDILEEVPTPHLPHDTSFSTTGSATTGEEFYPVSDKDGDVKWESTANYQIDEGSGNYNITKAKLVDFTNISRSTYADATNDMSQSTGEYAEIESQVSFYEND